MIFNSNGTRIFKIKKLFKRYGIWDSNNFSNTVWSKTFKNKIVHLRYNPYFGIEAFQLMIYDRNQYISCTKKSINGILKYLKKNLDSNELLEVERIIFTKI